LERRKYVYREGLYAKHVASNRYTGFKPFTPQTFANNPEMKAKVIKFIRREVSISTPLFRTLKTKLAHSSQFIASSVSSRGHLLPHDLPHLYFISTRSSFLCRTSTHRRFPIRARRATPRSRDHYIRSQSLQVPRELRQIHPIRSTRTRGTERRRDGKVSNR